MSCLLGCTSSASRRRLLLLPLFAVAFVGGGGAFGRKQGRVVALTGSTGEHLAALDLAQEAARAEVGGMPLRGSNADATGWRWRMTECAAPGVMDKMVADSWAQGWMAYGGQPFLQEFAATEFCTLPTRGTFTRAVRAVAMKRRRGGCSALPLARGEGGRWVRQIEWRPQGCTSSTWLGVSHIHQCLAGQQLLFNGDSMTRQLFNRLISWVRGQALTVEHFYHNNRVYSFGESGDRLEPTDKLPDLAKPPREEARVSFRFTWKDTEAREFGTLDPTIVAGVIMGSKQAFTVMWPELGGGGWRSEKLDLDVMNDCGGAPHFFRRNYLQVRRGGNKGGVPLDPVQGQKRFGNHVNSSSSRTLVAPNKEDTHFQCSMQPLWPKSVSSWKMPPNGDCRDLISLNALMAMLDRVCANNPTFLASVY